jgi:hypothetical protein
MALLLALLLQQMPPLTAAGSADVVELERRGMAVSSTGKYLVLGEARGLRIFDSATLAPVTELPLKWTGFGFDERDDRLLVVGDEVARIRTRDWTVEVRAKLPHAVFTETRSLPGFKPGQAMVLPDLDFYYRTEEGTLSLGSLVDGKVDEKPMKLSSDLRVTRLFGQFADVLALALDSTGGIALRGKLYYLVGCSAPFYAADLGNLAVWVGPEYEVLYAQNTWKVVTARKGVAMTCAAFDRPSGWMFVGDGQGLRGWHKDRFDAPERSDAIKNGLFQLTVDSPRRVLFTLEKKTLRRWKLPG